MWEDYPIIFSTFVVCFQIFMRLLQGELEEIPIIRNTMIFPYTCP